MRLFCSSRLSIPRSRIRVSFESSSECNQGRIAANKEYRRSFQGIGKLCHKKKQQRCKSVTDECKMEQLTDCTDCPPLLHHNT
ncbi:hypothetical protein TNCV_4891761 [Trichonephila clavipes]|nr:hypothetical protein TNCV_4891761 [Trichonephila clavipes]